MEYTTRILIADESPATRAQLRESLLRAGYRSIEEAANGEEALAKIERVRPAVVLLDVWLSKLDGIGLLRACRANKKDVETPIFIVVSSVTNQSLFVQASEAGADLCLPKPVNMTSLCNHIESLLAGRQSDLAKAASATEQSPDIESQVTQIIHKGSTFNVAIVFESSGKYARVTYKNGAISSTESGEYEIHGNEVTMYDSSALVYHGKSSSLKYKSGKLSNSTYTLTKS